jgi:hypothetical protein
MRRIGTVFEGQRRVSCEQQAVNFGSVTQDPEEQRFHELCQVTARVRNWESTAENSNHSPLFVKEWTASGGVGVNSGNIDAVSPAGRSLQSDDLAVSDNSTAISLNVDPVAMVANAPVFPIRNFQN